MTGLRHFMVKRYFFIRRAFVSRHNSAMGNLTSRCGAAEIRHILKGNSIQNCLKVLSTVHAATAKQQRTFFFKFLLQSSPLFSKKLDTNTLTMPLIGLVNLGKGARRIAPLRRIGGFY